MSYIYIVYIYIYTVLYSEGKSIVEFASLFFFLGPVWHVRTRERTDPIVLSALRENYVHCATLSALIYHALARAKGWAGDITVANCHSDATLKER